MVFVKIIGKLKFENFITPPIKTLIGILLRLIINI